MNRQREIVTITRRDLIKHGACSTSIADFDHFVPEGVLEIDVSDDQWAKVMRYLEMDDYITWLSEKRLIPPESGYIVCDKCDELVEEQYAIREPGSYLINDPQYCEDCFFDKFSTCEGCWEYYPHDEMMVSARGDEYLCEYCYSDTHQECELCNTNYHEDDMNEIDQPGLWIIVCDDCLDYHFENCQHCDQYTAKDEIVFNRRERVMVCLKCHQEIEDDQNEPEIVPQTYDQYYAMITDKHQLLLPV